MNVESPAVADSPPPRRRRWRRIIIPTLALVGLVSLAAVLRRHRMIFLFLVAPDMHNLPVDAAGYTIQRLPFRFRVSYARGHDVYFADEAGKVFKADDRDPAGSLTALGDCQLLPRLIFVTAGGTILVSQTFTPPVVRSTDGGRTWEKVMDIAVWRMDEDEQTGTLYTGNYTRKDNPLRATVYRSTDQGGTWEPVFRHDNHHIHTVRFDPRFRRVHASVGDKPSRRGQAFSGDGGRTWRWAAHGRYQGHTDVAFTDHHTIWGTDDHFGRIVVCPRDPVADGKTTLFGRMQQMWFVVAGGRQVYAGTFTAGEHAEGEAFLLASDDEGRTWKKLLTVQRKDPYQAAFKGDCRNLSADGWLFFCDSDGNGYRVRRNPS